MSQLRPRLFVASSSEGLDIAYAVQENLDRDAEVTVWTQGVFEPSGYFLESIANQLDNFDYGVFVFSFEDALKIRGEEVRATRDNVVFELGLFVGHLGRQRSFILMPNNVVNLHLPTDLLGIMPLYFQQDRSDKNLRAAVGPATNQIRRVMEHQGRRSDGPGTLRDSVLKQVSAAGVSAFYQSRADYAKYRSHASSIDAYVATAKQSVQMVSVNLMTGVPFDGLCDVLEKKLENEESPFETTISLLNPLKLELLSSLSPVLDMTSEQLAASIKNTLEDLKKLKRRLSRRASDNFNIRVHNAVPFGSAIILDGNSGSGTIQIETKPYRAPVRKSFAFEITDYGHNELFKTLRDAYYRLIADGEGVE